MSRYVFKPLTFYLDPNNRFAMKEFLDLYKKSLESGELFVDLREYDIYIANNGIEYPLPIIKTLREEVIKWIESDENPINILSKLDSNKDDKKRFDTIEAKREKIKELMETIKESEKQLKDSVDDNLNTLMRTEREVRYFYTNLSAYLLGHSKELTSLEKDIGKVTTISLKEMLEYYELLMSVTHKLSNFVNNEKEMNAVSQVLDEVVDMKKIINLGMECKNKLDKSFVQKEAPKFKIDINVTRNNSTVFDDSANSGLKEDTGMGYFSTNDLFNYSYDANNNKYTISLQ